MHWYTQLLAAMHMRIARRIRNNRICRKRRLLTHRHLSRSNLLHIIIPFPSSTQALQHPSIIPATIFPCLAPSPCIRPFRSGSNPGLRTMKAIGSRGSPLTLKNSRPFSSTKALKMGWMTIRMRYFVCGFQNPAEGCKRLAVALEPTTWMTMLRGVGGFCVAKFSSFENGAIF